MTVINMLSLGKEGIAVADEQSSTEGRKYNVAQKLHLLNDHVVYGGSGPSNYIREIYKAIAKELTEIKKQKDHIELNDITAIASNIAIGHRKHVKNSVLQSNLGISLEDFLTGTTNNGRKLDDSIIKTAYNLVQQFDNEARLGFLLGGIQNGVFDIYQVDSSYGATNHSRPYASIGSGADESEKVLSRFIASLSREKRESINREEGLVKIIEATNASSNLNVGVGGSPSIVYVNKEGKTLRPSEKQCILASELVKGFTYEILPKDFVYEAVDALVYRNEDFESTENNMWSKATDPKKLSRLLRGYKE